MIRHHRLEHRFVHHIPDHLDPAVLYISMKFATAIHCCCCGCGAEVVTPFTPTDWKLTFDGESVSLWPSIGNWQFQCRSHYVIEHGRIIEAPEWTREEIAQGRAIDKENKASYYGSTKATPVEPVTLPQVEPHPSWWSRLKRWFSKRQG